MIFITGTTIVVCVAVWLIVAVWDEVDFMRFDRWCDKRSDGKEDL